MSAVRQSDWILPVYRKNKKVLDGKFRGRRPVGRPQLRWKYIRIDLRRLDKDRDIWSRTTEEAKARCDLSRH